MPDDVRRGAEGSGAERVVRPVAIRDAAAQRGDDEAEHRAEPHGVEDHQQRTNDPPPLHHQDVEAQRNEGERDVLARQHRPHHRRHQKPVAARHGRVESCRQRRYRKRSVMEVVDNPREHAPEHQVRGLKSDAGERTELALAPQIDRNAGHRQQHRLGDQQNLR